MSTALDLIDREAQDELLQIRNDLMTVYREVVDGEPDLFALRYARSTPHEVERTGAVPVLVIPDGPGSASVLPYDAFRRQLAGRGVDVLMMEHRGVGLSRLDAAGEDLPERAMRLEHVIGDLLAVLDHARIRRVAIYGVGYGAYLAQALAALHPDRVHALVLDSPLTGADDEVLAQRALRARYWEGDSSIASVLRRLDEEGRLNAKHAGSVLLTVHEYGGPEAVRELVDLLAVGRGRLSYAGVREVLAKKWLEATPYLYERDLLGPIAHGQLGAGRHADGGPLDALELSGRESRGQSFEGEPWDLEELSRSIQAPTLVLSGEEDLLAPPEVARALVDRMPRAALVTVPATGHSLLDSHSRIAQVAVRWAAVGAPDALAERAAELVRLPEAPLAQALAAGVKLALAAERHSPWKLRLERAKLQRLEQLMSPASRRRRRVQVP